MTRRMMRQASVIAGPAVLLLGLVAAAVGQEPAEKQYQIRPRTEAFIKTHALAPDPNDPALVKAQKARLAAALSEMMHRTREFLRDSAQTDHLLDSGVRVLDAELDYYGGKPERVGVLEKHLEISRELATIIAERVKVDLASGAQEEYARYCRSAIEVALLKARREAAH